MSDGPIFSDNVTIGTSTSASAPVVTQNPQKQKTTQVLSNALSLPPDYVWQNMDKVGSAMYGKNTNTGTLWDKIKGSWESFKLNAEREEIGAKRMFSSATPDDMKRYDEISKELKQPRDQLSDIPNTILQTIAGLGYQATSLGSSLADWLAATLTGGMFNTKISQKLEQKAYQQQYYFIGSFVGGMYNHLRDEGHSDAVSKAIAGSFGAAQVALFALPVSKIPGVKKLLQESLDEATKRVVLDGTIDKISGAMAKKFAGRVSEIGTYNAASATMSALTPLLADAIEKNAETEKVPKQTVGEILKQIGIQTVAGTAAMGILGLPGAIKESSVLKRAAKDMVDRQARENTPEPAGIVSGIRNEFKPSEGEHIVSSSEDAEGKITYKTNTGRDVNKVDAERYFGISKPEDIYKPTEATLEPVKEAAPTAASVQESRDKMLIARQEAETATPEEHSAKQAAYEKAYQDYTDAREKYLTETEPKQPEEKAPSVEIPPTESVPRETEKPETIGDIIQNEPRVEGTILKQRQLSDAEWEKIDEQTRSEEGTSNYLEHNPEVERLNKLIEDQQAQMSKMNEKQRAQAQQFIDAIKGAKAETKKQILVRIEKRKSTNKMIRDIADVKKKLPTMVTGEKTIAEHEEFLKPLRQLLDEFNTKKPTQVMLTKLNDLRKNLEEGNTTVSVPKAMLDRLSELDKTPLRDLTPEDLQTVHDAVMAYATEAKQKASIFLNGKQVGRQLALNDVLSSMKHPKQTEEEFAKVDTNLGKTWRSFVNAVKDLAVIGHQQYDTMISLLFGGERSPGYDVFARQLENGTKIARDDRVAWKKQRDDFFDNNKLNQDSYFTKSYEIPDAIVRNDGTRLPLQVTKGHLLSAWMHRNWKQNWDSFRNGAAMPGWMRHGEVIQPIDADVISKFIDETLDDTDKAFLAEISDIVKNKMTPAMREKFYQNNGYMMEEPDFYWPINHARRGLSSRAAANDIVNQQIRRSGYYMGVDKGHVRPRVDSKAPIYWRPLQQDLADMISFASNYHGLSDAVQNMAKVVSDPDFKARLEDLHGSDSYRQAIINGINAATGGRYMPSTMEASLLKLRETGISSAMSFNISPVLRNLMLATRSTQYVPYSDWMSGIVQTILHPGKTSRALKEGSSYYSEISQQGNQPGIQALMTGPMRKAARVGMAPEMWSIRKTYALEMTGAMNYALRAFKEGIEDENISRASIGKAHPEGVKPSDYPNLTPEQRQAYALRFAEYVAKRTHASIEPQYESNAVLSGKPAIRFITTLGNEGNAATNMVLRAAMDARKTKGGWKRFSKMMVALGPLAIAGYYGERNLMEAAEKKKHRTTPESAALVTLGEMVYGGSQVAYAIEQGTRFGQVGSITGIQGQALSDALSMWQDISRAANDKTWKGRHGAATRIPEDGASFISHLTGIPYWPIRGYVSGIEQWAKGGGE